MKKIIYFFLLPVLFVGFTVSFGLKSSGGKAGKTGAPGENTCVQCHNSFDLNSGDGMLTLSSSTLEANEWKFTPGETYDFQVIIEHTGAAIFGFDVEALNVNGENSGVLIVNNADETQLLSVPVDGNERSNVTHKKNAGLATDTKTFTFQWTAPETDDETTFYLAANAANNNGGTSGDFIYSTTRVVTKNTTGIFSENAIRNMSAFPNPAIDFVELKIPVGLGNFYINVFNINGQLVSTELTNSFSVSDYKKGSYYAVLFNNENKIVSKANFIKL